MSETPQIPELALGLDYWEVTLKTGHVLTLRAHAFGEQDDHYVFVALMKGTPAFEYELLRVPISAVADVNGGWAAPREGGGERPSPGSS